MWVSLPVHPDKLVGTCQRQNVWGECWQHKVHHQAQTYCQGCVLVSYPPPIPPLPLHSSLPYLLCFAPKPPSLHPCPLPPFSAPSPASCQVETTGTKEWEKTLLQAWGEVRCSSSLAPLVPGCTHQAPVPPSWGSANTTCPC